MSRSSLLRRLAAPLVRRLQRHRPSLLVLHTGDHKTGSTSIQASFAHGISFGGKKVLYPGKMSHNGFASSLKSIERQARQGTPQPKHQKKVASFGTLIAQSPARYKLLSAEGLEGVAPATLAQALAEHFTGSDKLRIVSYVRPHATRLVSNYSEQVKIGKFAGSLEEYFAKVDRAERLDYAPRFNAWRQEFGQAFHLRPFLRSELKNGSILEDFTQTAFGKRPDSIPDLPAANSSLCVEDLMRLKVLQSHQRNRPQLMRHALGWEFARQIALLPPPSSRTTLHLPRALAEAVHARYRDDAIALDAAFFNKRPLMLSALEQAVDEAPTEAISTDPRDYFDAEEMRSLELMSDMVTSLLDTPDVDWARHLRQQRLNQDADTKPRKKPARKTRAGKANPKAGKRRPKGRAGSAEQAQTGVEPKRRAPKAAQGTGGKAGAGKAAAAKGGRKGAAKKKGSKKAQNT